MDSWSVVEEDARGVGQSTPKEDFVVKIASFQSKFTWGLAENETILPALNFPLSFKSLIVFTVAKWESVKQGFLEQGSQRWIWTILRILDTLGNSNKDGYAEVA